MTSSSWLPIVIASLLATTTSVESRPSDALMAIHNGCLAESGAPEDMIEALIRPPHVFNEDRRFKHYMFCILRSFGVYSTETKTIDVPLFTSYMPHDEYYDDYLTALATCHTPAVEDDYENCYQVEKCYVDLLKEVRIRDENQRKRCHHEVKSIVDT